MHGLGPPRVPAKPLATAATAATTSPSKYTWEKPRAGGTLESLVSQATRLPLQKPPFDDSGGGVVPGARSGGGGVDELVPWLDHHRAVAASAGTGSTTVTVDALVPCSKRPSGDPTPRVGDSSVPGIGTYVVASTRVGSCTGAATQDENAFLPEKRARVARAGATPEWSPGPDPSASASATFGRQSQQITLDCERDLGMGYTSTSLGSPENTSSGMRCAKATTADDHDSVCHSRAPVNLAPPRSFLRIYLYIVFHSWKSFV